MKKEISMILCTPNGQKLCDLYDSKSQFIGQATDVKVTYAANTITELSFKLPIVIVDGDGEQVDNYRWQYIKNEYQVWYTADAVTDVFVIKEPEDTSSGSNKANIVSCLHRSEHLKRKGLTKAYDPEIGNATSHLTKTLEGTGWSSGTVDTFYEEDLFDKFLTIGYSLVTTPADMSFGAYGEVRDATGASAWSDSIGWQYFNTKITSIGKNLCDGLIEKGALDGSTGVPVYDETNTRYRSINYMYVKPFAGETLCVDGDNVISAIWHYFNDAKEQIGFFSGSSIAVLPASGCSYVKYELLASVDGLTEFSLPPANVQIELGSTATTYEAYSAPYSISFYLGAHDSIWKNQITRNTVYDDTLHTYSEGSNPTVELLPIYSFKLYAGGHIYMENSGVGTSTVQLAYTVDADGGGSPREKYRSVGDEVGQSTYDALIALQDTFGGKVSFDGYNKTVNYVQMIGQDTNIGFRIRKNLKDIKRVRSSNDIITRLHIVNQTSEFGYIGIEEVNPLGTSFLLDFSYYRDIGMITSAQEAAIAAYEAETISLSAAQSALTGLYTMRSNSINTLVGQAPMGIASISSVTGSNVVIGTEVSYNAGGTPVEGDTVYVRKDNGQWEKNIVASYYPGTRTIVTEETPSSGTIAWWTSSVISGIIGALIITIETQQGLIADLEVKLAELTDSTQIAETEAQIADYETSISNLTNGTTTSTGLNQYFAQLVNEINDFNTISSSLNTVSESRITALEVFESAVGDFIHDGIFPSGEYASGQELALYQDALDFLREKAYPSVEYTVNGFDRSKIDGCEVEQIEFGDIVYVTDEWLGIENIEAEITKYVDEPLKDSPNSFDMGNFNEKPDAFFQSIVNAANVISSNKRSYDRAAQLLSDNGLIKADVIKNSVLSSGVNQLLDLSTNGSISTAVSSTLNSPSAGGSSWSLLDSLKSQIAIISQATIRNASILGAQIVSLSADLIIAGTLIADRIAIKGDDGILYKINVESSGLTIEELSDAKYREYLNGTVIVAKTITADQIAAGTITADEIMAHTITTDKLFIGDFTNIVQFDPVAYPGTIAVETIGSYKYFKMGPGTYGPCILATSNVVGFSVGDQYRFKFYGYRDAGVSSMRALIRYMYTDGTWDNAGSVILTVGTSDALVSGTVEITTAPSVTKIVSSVRFFLEKDSLSTGYYYYVRSPEIIRGTNGELIVNGSITAAKINIEELFANSATISEISAMTVKSLLNGTVLELNESSAIFRTPEFKVEIPGAEDGEEKLRIDADGGYMPQFSSPDVAKRKPGGIYKVYPGLDYDTLADAFADIEGAVLDGDVVLKVGADDAGGVLRGVRGGHRVIVVAENLIERVAYAANNSTLVADGSYGYKIVATTAGTYRSVKIMVGRVGDLGLAGKDITVSVGTITSSGGTGTLAVLRLYAEDEATLLGDVTSVYASNTSRTATIPADADDSDVVMIVAYVSQATSCAAGAYVIYDKLHVELGGTMFSDPRGIMRVDSLNVVGCDEVNMARINLPNGMRVRNTNAVLSRSEIYNTIFATMSKLQMHNNTGTCTEAVRALCSQVLVTGAAPGGTYTGKDVDTEDATIAGSGTAPTEVIATLNATSTGTYTTSWWTSDRAVRQGYTSAGVHRGGMWWNMAAIPTGATVSDMKLTLYRVSGFGVGDAVSVKIYGTSASARTGAPSLTSSGYVLGDISNGQTKTFTLPAALTSGLADGTYKGLVVRADDSSVISGKTYSSNYAKFGGTDGVVPKLIVTYTT